MPRLAIFTFGNLQGEQGDDHAGAKEFWEASPGVFQAMASSPGYVSGPHDSPEPDAWGAYVVPEFGDGREAQTLSLWEGLDSLHAAAYHGDHLGALKKRKEWFKDEEHPSHVLWWVDDEHTPTWQEARERHRELHENGPTASASNFRQPYGSDGVPPRVARPGA